MFRPFCLVVRLAAALTLTTAAIALNPPAAGAAAVRHPPEAVTERITNVAHRGASAYAPENTLTAFRLARAQGADMVEADVQETLDHELILMHDTTLARTTNAEEIFPDRTPWQISQFTLAEIRRLDAGSWFDERFQAQQVPTLSEALRVMRNEGLGLLLEVKAPELYPGIEQRIAGLLRLHPYWLDTDRWGHRLVVQSFSWGSMRAFHAILPWVPIGVLGIPAVEQLPRLAEFADQVNPYQGDLSPDYVQHVHALHMEVFTWSIQDPEGIRHAIAQNVDGIITGKPDVLRGILTEGGGSATAGPARATAGQPVG
jgi:glycerophosphoryl diester phosphodiesterase